MSNNTNSRKAAKPKNLRLKNATVAGPSHKPHVLHGYSLSTSSWRSKARFPGPFRLPDLPQELRNRIYENMDFNGSYRLVDLWHTKPNNLMKTLPPILATSRQLLQEAGSYFFSEGSFTCVVSGYTTKKLLAWMRLIGRANLRSLKKLDIRFALLGWEAMSHERFWPGVSRVLPFADAAELTGTLDVFDSLASQHPLLHRVRFSAQQQHCLPGREFDVRHEQWELDYQVTKKTTISISSIHSLSQVVRRLFELIGEGNVDARFVEVRTREFTTRSGRLVEFE